MSSKRITVFSNDPETPELPLTVKGEITVDVETNPTSISFGNKTKKEVEEKTFELKVTEAGKIKVTSVESMDERFEVTLKEGDPSSKATYVVKYKGSKELGRISSMIKINLEGGDAPFIELPLRARVVGNLTYPSSLYFSKKSGGFESRNITFESRTGAPFKILKATDPDNLLKIEKGEPEKKGAVTLVASVADPSKELAQPVRGEIKVLTTDKDEPEISIKYTLTTVMRPPVRGDGRNLIDPTRLPKKGEALKKRSFLNHLKGAKKD